MVYSVVMRFLTEILTKVFKYALLYLSLCSNFSRTPIFIEQNTVLSPSETDFSFNNEHNNNSMSLDVSKTAKDNTQIVTQEDYNNRVVCLQNAFQIYCLVSPKSAKSFNQYQLTTPINIPAMVN